MIKLSQRLFVIYIMVIAVVAFLLSVVSNFTSAMIFDDYYYNLLRISIFTCSVLFNETKVIELFKKNAIVGVTVGIIASIIYYKLDITNYYFSFEMEGHSWTGVVGIFKVATLTLISSFIGMALWRFKRLIIELIGLRRGLTKGLFTLWLCSFVIIECLILHFAQLEENYPVEYVVVLGAGLRGDTVSPTLQYRLDKCLLYLKTYPEAKVVVSGGQGPDEYTSEAEAMKRYLVTHSIGENRVILEERSTSTYENFLFSKKIIEKERGINKSRILIITSDFHMFRAKVLASRVGFATNGISAESVNYLKPYYYFREYFVVIKSFLLDR